MGDFEFDSLLSLKGYLDTLEKVNDTIIVSSVKEEEKTLEMVIQCFSCALEILDGLATPEEISQNFEELMEVVHQRTKRVDSIIMGYLGSMKLLHDAFFLSLTGRYASGRMLHRGAVESMIRGMFYYGLTQKEPNRKSIKNKRIRTFFNEVSRVMKRQSDLNPISLQNHMYEWLKVNKSGIHPGLRFMVKQLIDWSIWFRIDISFDEFWDELGFGESYSTTSGFVHIAFGTTYTYFESVLEELQTRKFWGAQFSKEMLKIQNESILDLIDFALGLLLSTFSLELISNRGISRLGAAPSFFSIMKEKMPLAHSSLFAILAHKKRTFGILERALTSQFSELEEIINYSVELIETKRLDMAIDFLSSARKVNANNPIVLHYLGLAYLESKSPRESLEYFDMALNQYSKFGTALYNKACALSRLNLLDDALSALAKAIEIDIAFRELATEDAYFDQLRSHKEFQKIVYNDRADDT